MYDDARTMLAIGSHEHARRLRERENQMTTTRRSVVEIESQPNSLPRYTGPATCGGEVVQVGEGRRHSLGRTYAATSQGWIATEILSVREED